MSITLIVHAVLPCVNQAAIGNFWAPTFQTPRLSSFWTSTFCCFTCSTYYQAVFSSVPNNKTIRIIFMPIRPPVLFKSRNGYCSLSKTIRAADKATIVHMAVTGHAERNCTSSCGYSRKYYAARYFWYCRGRDNWCYVVRTIVEQVSRFVVRPCPVLRRGEGG